MKKILALILALFLALPAGCLAGEVTWQEYADSLEPEALRNLAVFFQTQYIARVGGADGFDVPAGIYIVGTDFPIGSFSLEMATNSAAEVILYKDIETYRGDFPLPIFDQIMNEALGVTIVSPIHLAAGNVLVIEGHVTAKPFLGLGN